MHRLAFAAAVVAAVVSAPPARAADPAVAIAVGAATIVAGFAVGGTLMAAAGDRVAPDIAGWEALESGFALAPLAAHAVVGEWTRGVAFAAVPTATTLGTIPVFFVNSASVDHGTLPQQRVMWGLFCTGFAASMVGVIDTAFASRRRLQIAPVVAAGSAGLVMGGLL